MQQTAYARIIYERRAEKRKEGIAQEVVHRRKTILEIVKDFLRKVIAFLFTQVGVCGLLVLYNVAGAFCFTELEGVRGDSTVEDTADAAQDLLVSSLWNLTLQLNVLEESTWRRHADEAVAKYQETLVPLIRWRGYRGVLPEDAWSISASLMYCLSVYTTIGYGHLVPRTEAGKIATIFYGCIGMPLMLLYMSNVGEALGYVFKFIYFRICNCQFNKSFKNNRSSNGPKLRKEELPGRLDHHLPYNDAETLKHVKVLQINETTNIPILWCLLVIGLYVFIGGITFAHWEGWSVFNGCYFCYVSLSTIGFGDLVPGKVLYDDDLTPGIETRQIVGTIYLLVGMALVAMCFNLMQEEALESFKTFWRSIGCFRDKKEKREK